MGNQSSRHADLKPAVEMGKSQRLFPAYTRFIRRGFAVSVYAGRGENAVHQPSGLMGPVMTLHVPFAVALFPGVKSVQAEHLWPSFGVD